MQRIPVLIRPVFLVIFAIGLGLAACSSSEPSEGQSAAAAKSAPPTPAGEPAATATQAGEPAAKKALDAETAPPEHADLTPLTEGLNLAYDLMDNRYLAHLRWHGGLVIPCGDPGFLKYTQGTWKSSWLPMQTVDGEKAALTKGIQGTIRFPVDAETCKEGCDLLFDIKPLRDGQRVSIFVNGNEYPAVETPTGFRVYRLKLNPKHLMDLESKIRFHFRGSGTYNGISSAAAFRSIAIVPSGAELAWTGAVPERVIEVDVGGKKHSVFNPVLADRVDWYLWLEEESKLHFYRGAASGKASYSVRIAYEHPNNEAEIAAYESTGGGWRPTVADPVPLGPKAMRLSLALVNPSPDFVGGFGDPQILSLVSDPSDIAGADADLPSDNNVIVWLADTLRWDRLKAYNPKTRIKSPAYDKFTDSATTFLNHTVQGAHSVPSHATLLTGMYPEAHGHLSDATRLKSERELLSEALQKQGITTAIISSNGYVSTKWGFNQGWDYYKNFIREGNPAASKYLMGETKQWLKAHKDERFFLYLVSIDMHVAYRWRDEFCLQYDSEPYSGPVKKAISGHFLNKIMSNKIALTKRDRERMVATYDCNVTYNDLYFGELQKALAELGIDEKTTIIVVSDHGDEFFEHRGVGHGHSLYNELIRTPLVIQNGPGKGPVTVNTNVELVDLAPTVLDLLGAKPGAMELQGASLVPLMQKMRVAPRAAFSGQGDVSRSAELGEWKYILKHGNNAELYYLPRDTYETENLRKKLPVVDRMFRDILAFHVTFADRWKKDTWGVPNNHGHGFLEEALK